MTDPAQGKDWLAYNDLAWTERLLADPEDYRAEAESCIDLIRRAAPGAVETLLHLGSGAGGHDRFFKQAFQVTGVDLSPGMLALARETNPDVDYFQGDMRTMRLGRTFDAVAVPDSSDYLRTRSDIERTLATAAAHLKPGGVLLFVAKPAEGFSNNNFAYSGERDGVHVTLLENNHVDPARPERYQAVMVWLIRRGGSLSVHHETHQLGLFSRAVWEAQFEQAGFRMRATAMDGHYDQWLLGEGSYPMTAYTGTWQA